MILHTRYWNHVHLSGKVEWFRSRQGYFPNGLHLAQN